jgi:hypothetical protein
MDNGHCCIISDNGGDGARLLSPGVFLKSRQQVAQHDAGQPSDEAVVYASETLLQPRSKAAEINEKSSCKPQYVSKIPSRPEGQLEQS